jgi:phenylalanyl-tRNA synthetase beta chain
VATLPFVGSDTADRLGLAADDPRAALVRISNPIAEDAARARPSLLPGLFGAVTRNVGRGQTDLALFETGLVFRRRPGAPATVPTPTVLAAPSEAELAAIDAVLPEQPRMLAAVLTGLRRPAGWWGPGQKATWADAIEAARIAARAVGVTLTVDAAAEMPWHPGRCAALRVDGELIGFAGELHPRVLAAYDLPARACALELDLGALVAAGTRRGPVVAVSPSPFPPADRDVALLVDVDVPAAAVAGALRSGAGELLESLALFDVYEGAQAGAGRRSLAFGLRLRADDRTLTAEEANAARDAAIAEAGRRTGAVQRA